MTRRDELEEALRRMEERFDASGSPPDIEIEQGLLDTIEDISEYRLKNGLDEPLPDELRERLKAHGFDPDNWPPVPPGGL